MRAQFRLKPVTLPSGRIVEVMGYEPYAIKWLFDNGFSEDDIIYNGIKSVKYDFNDKSHRYKADFYIPKTNTLIEVKSTWTLKADKEKNYAKINGSITAGFNHWLLVFDRNGNLLEEKITNAKI